MVMSDLCERSAAKREDAQERLTGRDIEWATFVALGLWGTRRRGDDSYFG